MLELKVSVGRPTRHCERRVSCNGSLYSLPLPLETYHFVEIAQEIVFQKQQEQLIAILSGKRDSLPSFQQFYQLQDDGLRYFNLKPELNFDDLALKLLSDTDKILLELDNCKFVDLLAIIRKGYDAYSKKLHSKFNRRIKKYLTFSYRSQTEKQQIRKLVQLIKADSTDEEPISEVKEPKKESPAKVAKKVEEFPKKVIPDKQKTKELPVIEVKEVKEAKEAKEEKKVELEQAQLEQDESPEQKPAKKEEKHSHFYEEIRKGKRHSNKHQPHKKGEDGNDDDWEDVEEEKKPQKGEKPKRKEKHNKHEHKKEEEEEEDDEDDWQDIKEEKIHKRKQKNNRRKHQKFDPEPKKETLTSEINSEKDNEVQINVKKEKENNKRSVDNNKRVFEKSKQKPKRDLRVLLGLNGDTDDGWRERYRVERVPAALAQAHPDKSKKKWVVKDGQESLEKKEKNQQKSPFQKPEKSKKKQNEEKQEEPTPAPIPAPKVVMLPSQGTLQKIFSFPADGTKFTLDSSKQYRIRVNNNFWIMLEKNLLKIEKDKSGYIRDGKFNSNEECLIEGQDLTISLTGVCNLEDGGTPFGNPQINNFTGTDSQWFHLKELEIYTYK